MDIVNKLNNAAFGYNQQVKAINRIKEDGVWNEKPNLRNSSIRFGEGQYAVPFRLALSSSPDDMFTLPLDPVVAINGSNAIVKREIAKAVVDGDEIRGTVKELWTQDDWKISVSGVLTTTGEAENENVNYYIRKLTKLLTAKEALIVECDVLNNEFEITRVVVESFDFPFTKGVENQSFSFSLISDDSYNLEIQ